LAVVAGESDASELKAVGGVVDLLEHEFLDEVGSGRRAVDLEVVDL
jgi:hypothetical protein